MNAIVLGVAAVWAGTGIIVIIAALVILRDERPALRRKRVPHARGHRREEGALAPDPEILVPWSAVRRSNERLGVRPPALRDPRRAPRRPGAGVPNPSERRQAGRVRVDAPASPGGGAPGHRPG